MPCSLITALTYLGGRKRVNFKWIQSFVLNLLQFPSVGKVNHQLFMCHPSPCACWNTCTYFKRVSEQKRLHRFQNAASCGAPSDLRSVCMFFKLSADAETHGAPREVINMWKPISDSFRVMLGKSWFKSWLMRAGSGSLSGQGVLCRSQSPVRALLPQPTADRNTNFGEKNVGLETTTTED